MFHYYSLSGYLDMFDASSASNESRVQPQRQFSEPVRIVKNYPYNQLGDLEKKNMVCLGCFVIGPLTWRLSE